MPLLTAQDGLAFAALFVLVALPGLTIVRASFSYVPLLSVSYWLVSWGWISPHGPGRRSFLLASLVFFGLLAGLRLLKPLGLERPARAALVVTAAAFLRLVPFAMWPVAPGLPAGFDAASSLLLAWHDAVPRTMLPLYPVEGFGHGGFGLAAFAADLALLSGAPAPRAHLLALLAAEGLFVLGLFGVLRRRWPAEAAAALAAAGGALVAFLVEPTGASASALLSLALGVSGVGLVAQGEEWPTTVAGALFLAAAVVAHGAVGLVALGAALVLGARRFRRPATAVVLAALLALPAFWRGIAFPRPSLADISFALILLVALEWGMKVGSISVPRWAVAAGVVAVLLMGIDWKSRSRAVAVEPSLKRGAAWLERRKPRLALVCADDPAVRAWLPVLSGNPVAPPLLPSWAASHRLAPPSPGPGCTVAWAEVLTFSDETPHGP